MQKFIFRTFLTALLIYALDGAFAGPGEKEKEYEAERTFCSPRSILNEAKRILETNPRSLEAHLKFTKVARAWLNSEKKEEFDGARQALDRASEFMEDSRNDPRTRGRIAIEVADILTIPSDIRRYKTALYLIETLLETNQNYNVIPELLSVTVDSEDAGFTEKEEALKLRLKYAKCFRPEVIFEEYQNIFTFYRATAKPGETKTTRVLDEVIRYVKESPSFEGYVFLAKYFENEEGIVGNQGKLARKYYKRAAFQKFAPEILERIRMNKRAFFNTPEEFYMFLIMNIKHHELPDTSHFQEIMKEESSPTARFLKLYWENRNMPNNEEDVRRFYEEGHLLGYPLYHNNLLWKQTKLRGFISHFKIRDAEHWGKQNITIFGDDLSLIFSYSNIGDVKDDLAALKKRKKELRSEIVRCEAQHEQRLNALDSKELHDATGLYYLMFQNFNCHFYVSLLNALCIWDDYTMYLEILTRQGNILGLQDYIFLTRNHVIDRKKEKRLKKLLDVLQTPDLNPFEMVVRYQKKYKEIFGE